MKFKIEIDCNNAAFEDDPADEIERILRGLSANIIRYRLNVGLMDNIPISDINGNRVGRAWIEGETT